MRFKSFNTFILESVNTEDLPSQFYKRVKERWDGGYDIQVIDAETGVIENPDMLHIIKKTPKAIALAYSGIDNNISKYFWIPNYCCKIKKGGDGNFYLEIPSYTNWFKDTENSSSLEDFLNDFIEVLEQRSADKIDKLGEYVKDEINLLLDQIGLESNVVSIKNKEKVKFEALTDDGKIIELRKIDQNTPSSEIKVYLDDKSVRPMFTIEMGSKGIANFRFNVNDKYYDRSVYFSNISDDKYFNYLLKKSMGIESAGDQEGLVEYFNDVLKNYDWDYQMSDDKRAYETGQKQSDLVRDIKKLLSDFLSEEKIDSIYKEFSSNK
jgi:hypothetical protein